MCRCRGRRRRTGSGSLGDRSDAPLADRAIVDFSYGSHLGGGSRQKHFVGDPQLVSREAGFDDRYSELSRERNDRVARHPLEDGAGEVGGIENPLSHDEDVLAGPFAHVAVHVEQDRLVVPTELRFSLGDDAIGVLPGHLGFRQSHVDVVARKRADLGANAALQRFFAKIRAPLPRDDRGVDGVARRVNAHRALADVHHRPEVPVGHVVDSERVDARAHHLLASVLRLEEAHLA